MKPDILSPADIARRPLRLLAVVAVAALASVLLSAGTGPDNQGAGRDRGTRPPAVDLRPELDRFGLSPRVQGKRGTCSAFVMTGALEYAFAKQGGKGDHLSVEFLNWASNRAIADTADGGFFSDLWAGFAAHGICTEATLPYRETYQPDLDPPAAARLEAAARRSAGLRLHWIKEWDPNRGLNDAELEELLDTLDRGWPVAGGFLWPKSAVWTQSLLEMVPRDEVFDGHSLLLVGYRDDPDLPGGGAVLVRNSGGPSRDGMLTYDYLRAYMNDAVWIDYTEQGQDVMLPPALPGFLSLLDAPPAGRARRFSSNEQPDWHNANMDMTMIPPGASVEVPLLEGPGMITHIWMTSHAGWVAELNSLTLRIWYDERSEPGVEVPLGMFFAVGPGMPMTVNSFPVQVSPSGSLSCYWRMPFARSARIRITNDNPDRMAGLYWQIDWLQLADLPPDTPYFHARFRREYPARPGDYHFADLAGAGHYVGTVMAVTMAQDGWYGEGDDFFYIDGETVPSLQGTGSEDYFNDAWGARIRTTAWFGQPRWQGYSTGDTGVMYRWHLLDPIGFARSLSATIEHKGNRASSEDAWYLERPDFISSVAFWYQTGEPQGWEPIPSWQERRVPWQTHHLVRAFRSARVTGTVRPEVRTEGFFGARPVLAWPNSEPGERLTLPFSLESGGRFAVRLTAMGSPGQGRCDITIDGRPVLAGVDLGTVETEELDLLLGTMELGAGAHELGLVALPDGEGSAGPVAVELLRLLPLPPEATREVKTHLEAHFIRLGIGRAVYAYRLAYDRLPASFDELVSSGIMPERYRTDENGLPLSARLEGGRFVVESRGPEPWTHSWQGLDARR